MFLSLGKLLVQELVKFKLLDQLQCEPRATELTIVFNANCFNVDTNPTRLNRFVFVLKE